MEQIMISNKQQHHKNDNNILRRMHRDSQTILSKNKPQVRIIHIFAPEIIKTDPANFRELVQRLTGKPSVSREKLTKKRPKSGGRRVAEEDNIRSKVETVKSEEAAEIWRSSSSSGGSGDYNESGGFLAGFTDMEDGFMQQLGLFQPSLDLLPQNHNPALIHHHHQHPYRYNQNQQQQQQQQQHFFGEEDQHTHNYRVI